MQTVDNLAAPDPLSSGEGMLALAEGERWFAVHSLPLRETYAEGNLKNQGFRTFMPKRHKTVRHARRLTTVEAPFFPRYLFVVLDLDRDQWRKVNGTFGVARLIMGGEQPRPVPYGVVEALTASADTRGILHLDERLKIGSRVRLLAGSLRRAASDSRTSRRIGPGSRAGRDHGPAGLGRNHRARLASARLA